MGKNRAIATAVVAVILAGLVYLQFRTWTSFEWSRLLQYDFAWRHILHGIELIYLAYFLRALRWKIFLRPVRKHASTWGLLSPTLVGFTGLALLGRPGELIRPYLVARRENLSLASQLAVWAVERIFDVGGFTVLMVAAIFLPSKLRAFAATRPELMHWLHVMGYVLTGLVLGLFAAAMAASYKGEALANWVEN